MNSACLLVWKNEGFWCIILIKMIEVKIMLCLDANAFYWYYGRDKLPLPPSVPKFDVSAMKNFLDARSDKSLAASAYMEMLVHFRDKPNIMREIIKFREQKRIKIYNNLPERVFTPDELSLYMFMTDDALILYANKLLETKIEIETKFSYAFMQVVNTLYANYCLDSNCNIQDFAKDNILKLLCRDMSEALREDYYLDLKNSLIDGYNDNNKSQQYLKKKYIELLTQKCVITHMIIQTVENVDSEEDLYAFMCNVAVNVKNNGFNETDTMKTISSELDNDSVFLQFAEKEIGNIFKKKGYTLHQSKYIVCMLKAWLERGQKLRKNDIFDMICIASLDKINLEKGENILIDPTTYLITFDDAMVDFIKNTKSNNFKMIDQFYFH